MGRVTWHGDLPWYEIKAFYRWFRREFFSSPRARGLYLRVGPPPRRSGVTEEEFDPQEAQLHRLRKIFGWRSYAPNWETSYHKRGEDLNLARVKYSNVNEFDPVWWQYHIRGYLREDGSIDLKCHYEPEPTEHPKAHMDGVGYSNEKGMNQLRHELDLMNIGYEEVHNSVD